MALEPVSRSSVAGAVYDQLSGEILAGRYDAGQALPAERALAELLGVNRGAVREAIQRLAAAGLVESRQGSGTVVLDYRRSGGLDLLPELLAPGGLPQPGVIRGIAELRSCIGTDAARLAALRRTPADLRQLDGAASAMEAAVDLAGRQVAALELWDAVVDASDNIAYRLALNSLVRTYQPLQPLLRGLLSDELDDVAGHRAVVAHVAAGRADDAARAAAAVLARGAAAFTSIADALGESR